MNITLAAQQLNIQHISRNEAHEMAREPREARLTESRGRGYLRVIVFYKRMLTVQRALDVSCTIRVPLVVMSLVVSLVLLHSAAGRVMMLLVVVSLARLLHSVTRRVVMPLVMVSLVRILHSVTRRVVMLFVVVSLVRILHSVTRRVMVMMVMMTVSLVIDYCSVNDGHVRDGRCRGDTEEDERDERLGKTHDERGLEN